MLYTDNIIVRALGLCAALWCVAGVAAVLMPSPANNAPAARAASPVAVAFAALDDVEPPVLRKADRLPMPAIVEARAVPVVTAIIKAAPHAVKVYRERTDKVCGKRGRRWFWRHHHHSWRCRR